MGTDTSAINSKKEESKPAEKSKNNWKGFGTAVLNSFVQVMVLGIVGANLLYVVSPANLQFLFPDDTSKRPYTDKGPSMFSSNSKAQKGGADKGDIELTNTTMPKMSMPKMSMPKLSIPKAPSMSQLKEKAKIAKEAATKSAKNAAAIAAKSGATIANKAGLTQVGDMLNKTADIISGPQKLPPDHCGLEVDPITGTHLFSSKPIQDMYDYGFPYNLKYAKNSNDKSVLGFLKNWIGVNTEKSYAGLREIISKIIGYMEISCELNKDAKWKTLPIFILAPVILCVILMIAQLWSIPTVLYYMLFNHESTNDLIFTIVGLFLGWTIFLAGGASLFQMFGMMFIFLLLPLLTDSRRIMKILGKRYHSLYLFILFLLLVTSNAFTHLTSDVALAMFVPFIFAIVSSIRHVANKQ